jgi:hypothetical protein
VTTLEKGKQLVKSITINKMKAERERGREREREADMLDASSSTPEALNAPD